SYDAMLYEVGNVQSLVNALCKVIEKPKLRDRLSTNLRKKKTERSWQIVANKTLQLYMFLLNPS
ncbi:MAG: glycosyltransferase, partial [Promethearchaeota archaeon]